MNRDGQTTLILIADSHEPAVFPGLRGCFDKRFLGYGNDRLKRRFLHDQKSLDNAVRIILARKPDCVLFAGDAVSTSNPLEFKHALPHFQPLINSRIPLLCTAGNHDCYVRDASCRAAMLNFYRSLAAGREDVFSPGRPMLRRIGHLRLIALPEARPVAPWLSCGFLSAESLEFLEREAESGDPAPLVLLHHFPLLERSWRRSLRNAERARALLKAGKIALSLCGHVHHPSETLDERGRGELVAGSVTRYGVLTEIIYDAGSGVFTAERIFPGSTEKI